LGLDEDVGATVLVVHGTVTLFSSFVIFFYPCPGGFRVIVPFLSLIAVLRLVWRDKRIVPFEDPAPSMIPTILASLRPSGLNNIMPDEARIEAVSKEASPDVVQNRKKNKARKAGEDFALEGVVTPSYLATHLQLTQFCD